MSRQTWALIVLSIVAPIGSAAAETVDDLIAKNVDSRGGRDALAAVRSARVSGTLRIDGVDHPCSIEWKRPNKFRLDYEWYGLTSIRAFDGEVGWSTNPFAHDPNPMRLPQAQLDRIKAKADYIDGELVDYRGKGHTIELIGKETVDGVEGYKLKVNRADGTVGYVYLDTRDCLVFRTEGRVQLSSGRFVEKVAVVSDYKRVGDILMAHSVDITLGRGPQDLGGAHGAKQSMVIHSIALNVEIEDAHFSMDEPMPTQ